MTKPPRLPRKSVARKDMRVMRESIPPKLKPAKLPLVEEFFRIVQIDSLSLSEEKMFHYLEGVFAPLVVKGVLEYEMLHYTVEELGQSSAHMLVHLPANCRGRRSLFFDAHVDTVSPGKGIVPRMDGSRIVSSGDTILAADDKAAVAAMIMVIKKLVQHKSPHGDLIFVFSSAEEISLTGIRYFDFKRLKGRLGFILDSYGPVGSIITKAPYQLSYQVQVEGRAVHAGIEPEKGANAISAAAAFISSLPQGRINSYTTANVGKISGGRADNIVASLCNFSGEFRSLNKSLLQRFDTKIKSLAKKISRSYNCNMKVTSQEVYQGFSHSPQSEIVKLASAAIKECGMVPNLHSTGGGSNANYYNAAELRALTLSTGMEKIHSLDEYIEVLDLFRLQHVIEKIISLA